MKNILIIAICGIFIYFAYGFFKKDIYIGFVYPDGCLSCESKWIKSPQFTKREQCLDWAHDILRKRDNSSDDFECAKNCKEENGLNICEETFDY